ncbi:MAG: phospholipid carrier-dependent glycosyltransferase, partial [Phaeodactylibacter sp.]|nr:phospholipid carrier-dependent glycosyltransferase [Phaeodactylibacter sp.]
MTKRKQSKKSEKPSKPTPKVAQPTVAAPAAADEPALYRKIFWGLTGVAALWMIILALGVGINGDDIYQIDYSNKLLSYYSTFGQDTAALNIPKGNMHYYGGLFDILAGGLNNMFGLEENDWAYHDVRHLLIVLFGWLAMLFTALLVRELAGWRTAILAFLMIFLSPRFLGHSLMNPKDIPFAMGTMMAIYFLFRWMRSMPQPKLWDMIGLAGGIAIALAAAVATQLRGQPTPDRRAFLDLI